ncbi:sigma factor [Ancylobacter rudongensis]|uniref:Sigma-70 region 2 n=1 Tax=Ancylobacter rudongensis TaxID=177413 RepID=A0A1G4US26_9HYPH|nr:sigma factor [Ancylobacter rudongensis]SCW95765.1 Sigma-70 region 2 [Ancylobacter rudongensis]
MQRRFNPADSAKQIKAFAARVHRRLKAAGAASHAVEDVEQELWCIWCKACDAYDPTQGASFKTFLHKGMQLYINRYVEKHVSRRHAEVVALSIDYSYGDEDDNATLGDAVSAGDKSAEDELAETDLFGKVIDRLSARARLFVTLLHEEPAELVNEVKHLEQKGDYARSRGLPFKQSLRVTSRMVFELMAADHAERRAILEEINHVTRKLA